MSKYIDLTSVVNVIGNVFLKPSLLDDEYPVIEEDFESRFHQILFGAIFKLHELGVKDITLGAIDDFLKVRPKSYAIYQQERGAQWLIEASENCSIATFPYYYDRLKKMSLLRAYDYCGIDVTDIYDPDNLVDVRKRQEQENFLDNQSLVNIADLIDDKVEQIRRTYLDQSMNEAVQAGSGIFDLITRFEEVPEVGVPLYGNFINTVTRGARLGKFYLRSAPTGCGKTRSMIADACYIGCDSMYYENTGWVNTGAANPVLYITTEQDLSEIQTMMLAFLSNVNEDHILDGKYEDGEKDRVLKAAEILARSPIYVEELPDFSLQDIENTIKRNIRKHNIRYVMHDYIHTSIKILEEITRRSGGVRLREDNILFMLSTRMKDICKEYDVFILSATQLNGDYQESKTPDQNLLRGAKAIADKIDYGSILLPVKDIDLEGLKTILGTGMFAQPTLKLSVYKNRRGKYKGIILWCQADLGCCRINPLFCTTFGYDLVTMKDLNIFVKEECAFEQEIQKYGKVE